MLIGHQICGLAIILSILVVIMFSSFSENYRLSLSRQRTLPGLYRSDSSVACFYTSVVLYSSTSLLFETCQGSLGYSKNFSMKCKSLFILGILSFNFA